MRYCRYIGTALGISGFQLCGSTGDFSASGPFLLEVRCGVGAQREDFACAVGMDGSPWEQEPAF